MEGLQATTEPRELPERSPMSSKRSYDAMGTSAAIPMPNVLMTNPIITTEASPSPGDLSTRESVIRPTSPSRQASPALSATSTSLTSLSSTPPLPTYGLDGTASTPGQPEGQPSAKRRKLTFAEKEQRKVEKEAKDAEKAEAKAKKDEEKRVKDEERRKKNEALEEKRREKALEQLKKDEEKRKVEEEKARKERAQSRMTTFFAKPQTPAKSGSGPGVLAPEVPDFEMPCVDESIPRSPSAPHLTDYQKTFLPYELPKNTDMASIPPHTWDAAAIRILERHFLRDSPADDMQARPTSERIRAMLHLTLPVPGQRNRPQPTVSELMKSMAGSQTNLVDLTGKTLVEDPMKVLQRVTMRFLEFSEDVRPPYIGTYTKACPPRLYRNPFAALRTDTDYDYDSEAEWEEPEEGEELASEGESEGESVDAAEDLEGFLDDEGTDGQPTRKKTSALPKDLEPISSGLCFEDVKGQSHGSDGLEVNLREFRLELLLDSINLPIDPFSDEYWPKSDTAKVDSSKEAANNTLMPAPARPPLQEWPDSAINGTINTLQATSVNKSKSEKPKATSKILTGPELDAFKQEIDGSEHNKAVLVGLLKKKFPNATKQSLTDTLGTVAMRVGRNEAEKKWILV